MKKTGRKKGCIPWNKGIPRTEEEKKKMSLSAMGRTINENQRRGLEKGRGWNKGKKYSEEIRKKMSDVAKEQYLNGRTPWNKKPPILCKYCGTQLSQRTYKMCIDCYLKKEVGKKLKGVPKTIEFRKKVSEGRKNSPKVPRGEKHPSWKGGITPEHEKIRKSNDYKLWRNACLKRDNYICQDCGKRGGNLEVHHIKSFWEYKLLRLDIKNGITYCVDCHKKNDIKRGGKVNELYR